MIDSRCGLHCSTCTFKEACGCGGCIETMGNPFHGQCRIAICCQDKGYTHCGQCPIMPCDKLIEYSYLDREHGDKPLGERVGVCRRWAAEDGQQAWNRVLLTSAGFEDDRGKQKKGIVNCFLGMLGKPIADARILFIPTAAIDDEAKEMAEVCKQELMRLGATQENICTYNLDAPLSWDAADLFDVIYFTGGDTAHLLACIKKIGFDDTIKRMVHAGKVYVGVSAGSLIATPGIHLGDPFEEPSTGLCLINRYLSVHCKADAAPIDNLPLPHIPLTDNQALVVSWDGYHLIEG